MFLSSLFTRCSIVNFQQKGAYGRLHLGNTFPENVFSVVCLLFLGLAIECTFVLSSRYGDRLESLCVRKFASRALVRTNLLSSVLSAVARVGVRVRMSRYMCV